METGISHTFSPGTCCWIWEQQLKSFDCFSINVVVLENCSQGCSTNSFVIDLVTDILSYLFCNNNMPTQLELGS